MCRKSILITLIISASMALIVSSCGGGGGAAKSPTVIVTPDNGGNTSDPGNNTGDSGGSISIDDGSGNTTPVYVVIIQTDSSGNLNINNETVNHDAYTDTSVSVKDENGNQVSVAVDNDGNIKITPADGSAEGTYTVIIDTGEREYLLIITVDSSNNATVNTAISYPSGSSLALDLDSGVLSSGGGIIATITSGSSGNYSLDSSVKTVTVTDKNGNIISVEIDPVTGDVITGSGAAAPYNFTIVMADGRVLSFTTDSTGKITGNVSESGRAVMVDLDNGTLSSGGVTLTLTGSGSTGWTLAGNVEIIEATAGGRTIVIPSVNINVNSSTGDIMITGGGTTTVPAGPYEIRVSVDGKQYIIKTDESGTVTGIVPGNILLDLNSGYAVHSGSNIIKITNESNGSWSISGQISSLQGKDSSGNSVSISIDSSTGDLATPDSAAGEVTVTFLYTDNKGNIISYTMIVVNGNVMSYTAEISEPGPDFDFSTVTNVKISLKVADEKTGLPLGQASINLMKADGSLNWEGFTNDSGISVFTATVDSANKTAKVIVTRAGYETVICSIDGLGKLIEFGRNIAMKPVEAVVVKDNDGDGVPDQDDQYPEDPAGAKKITGVYTLAFEDLYPQKGDADFNDVVVRLTLEEKIDSQNMLRQIVIKTKLLASGAGYHNRVAINLYNKKIVLIEDARALLGSTYNSRSYEIYKDVAETSYTLAFDTPVDRKNIAPMPYDPFIVCNRVEGREVHLPFVKTSYKGIVLDTDGFPWAMLVPDAWSWPYESGSIFNAYPEFDDWYLSGGATSADWYLRPDSRYIYQR